MKPGWQTSTLGDVLAVLRNGINCKQSKSGKGDRISRIESISDASFDLNKVGYAELRERDNERYRLQPGDILFSHINSAVHVGKTAVFHGAEPVYHGVNLLLMRPKAVVTSAYLEHALKFLFLSGYWRGMCKQSVNQASVNQQDISRVAISYPKLLSEQKRIVGILDQAFEGVSTAKANAEKNLQNAHALFESHLQSVFTQRGPGWVETTLEKVLAVQPQNGWSPPAANHSDSGTPVLTLSSVTGFRFRPNKLKFTSASTDSRRNYWVKNGDLLITRSNTPELVGHVAIAEGITEPTIYPDLIMRMNPMQDRVMTEFIYYQMRTPALRKEITGRAQGANPTMKKISNGAVKTLPIAVPSIATQRAIVETLNGLTEETKRLESIYERKLAALEALKKSLLHKAFTGEL
jgi:type I restriction enzyme, S subunit